MAAHEPVSATGALLMPGYGHMVFSRLLFFTNLKCALSAFNVSRSTETCWPLTSVAGMHTCASMFPVGPPPVISLL